MDRPRQSPQQQIDSHSPASWDTPHQQPEQQQVGVHLPEHGDAQRQQSQEQGQGQSGTVRPQQPPDQRPTSLRQHRRRAETGEGQR